MRFPTLAAAVAALAGAAIGFAAVISACGGAQSSLPVDQPATMSLNARLGD